MPIIKEDTIWYPGVYAGRNEPEYTQTLKDLPLTELIRLVQQRVQEDGEWTIANGFVGDNEDKMRRMMQFAASETNIKQCLAHILAEKKETVRTVDWVCRDLANASKVMIK